MLKKKKDEEKDLELIKKADEIVKELDKVFDLPPEKEDFKKDLIKDIERINQDFKALQKEENQSSNKSLSLLSEIDSAQIQISNLCQDIERDYSTINAMLKDFDQDLAKKQATGLHSALRYQSAIIHKIKGTLLDDQGRIGNMVSNTKIIDRTIKSLKKKTEE